MSQHTVTKEQFRDFQPQIMFASDSESHKRLYGIWYGNEHNETQFHYEVTFKGVVVIATQSLDKAIEKYNVL